MIVIANRQLQGSYGTFAPETSKALDQELADQLLKLGLVRLPEENSSEPVKPVTPMIETPKTPELETQAVKVVPETPAVAVEQTEPIIATKSEGK